MRNANGTHDVGPLQSNTGYLKQMGPSASCQQISLREAVIHTMWQQWRLRQHILQDGGYLWTGAANFHSRTRRINMVDRRDLMRRAASWVGWIAARYATHEISTGIVTPKCIPHS
jgi:hypothetical protein